MEYSYNIINVDAREHWIFISHEDWDEPDGFISLVKKIRDDCNGVIVNLGDTRYKIDGDGMNLIYQYDNLFGTVVIYRKAEDKDAVIDFLKKYFSD